MRLFACLAVVCAVKFNCVLGRIALVLAAVAWALRPRAAALAPPLTAPAVVSPPAAEPDAVASRPTSASWHRAFWASRLSDRSACCCECQCM